VIPLSASDFDAETGTVQFRISYSTTKAGSAVQWLAESATADKKAPFLFTQCQAIHARTLLPCQDTPMVKATHSARIRCPAGTTAVMSALGNGDEPVDVHEDGSRTFAFTQPVAVAAYLVALAVGHLVSKEVGPRSSVWAEPSVVDAAVYEFGETEEFLQTGERICGPYVWTRYDILCMPPSFPYGGMENPCLTFVTPTLLAGDRSLADTVIHEITHSWTGNLVTNRTWEHFWLNEGWTMVVQRKIVRDLYGQKVADLDAFSHLSDLRGDVDRYGQDHNFTRLVPDLSADGGLDPDDSFSTVPYEKGHALLASLQHTVGGAAVFDPYIKAYVVRGAAVSFCSCSVGKLASERAS
jgi:leukotriene-A4 hydrolase